ncbi:hypothetical protein QPW83_11985 [Legionella pneumophila]|nr:hypothetical protein [Legionella pneumophila subsp. fraseri]HCJ4257417.1 hypothetical protein [Legionella pneumophila]
MEMKAWIIGALWVLIIVLLGFMVYFRKKKKTTRFYMILIISLALLAIFLHGASFQLH